MAVRNRRRCHNCPAPTPTEQPVSAAPNQKHSVSQTEGLRLWKHVLFGTSTCVGMIEGYAALKLPGNPLAGITQLRDRLNQLITQIENDPMFQISLPQSDLHSQIKITVSHPKGESETTLDDSHKVMRLNLPEGVDLDDVEIIAEFVGRNGSPDPAMRPMLLKEKVEREEPKAEEPKIEEPVTPAAEPSQPPVDEPANGPDQPADGSVPDAAHADAGGDHAEDAAPRGEVSQASVEQEADASPAEAEVAHESEPQPAPRGRKSR